MSTMDYPIEPLAKAFKPMLSATCEDIAAIRYPVLVSPKLDGIRCLIRNGVAVSRNLKEIPNAYIQRCLKGLPDGLDGELIVGKPTGDDVWNRSSAVMKRTGEPGFTYWVFDYQPGDADMSFMNRLHAAMLTIEDAQASDNSPPVKLVKHVRVDDAQSLAVIEAREVEAGYEGVMLRDPNGKYKFGRSTVKEGGLMKLKRFYDTEATVIGVTEQMRNDNVATTDALGRTKRSTHKANKTGKGTLGALVCKVDDQSDTFEIGTGMDDATRAELWANRDTITGKLVKFKYQSMTPAKVPRFPVYIGIRQDGA